MICDVKIAILDQKSSWKYHAGIEAKSGVDVRRVALAKTSQLPANVFGVAIFLIIGGAETKKLLEMGINFYMFVFRIFVFNSLSLFFYFYFLAKNFFFSIIVALYIITFIVVIKKILRL
jgi:hypothetical protein